jgi:hypothetical protein
MVKVYTIHTEQIGVEERSTLGTCLVGAQYEGRQRHRFRITFFEILHWFPQYHQENSVVVRR